MKYKVNEMKNLFNKSTISQFPKKRSNNLVNYTHSSITFFNRV